MISRLRAIARVGACNAASAASSAVVSGTSRASLRVRGKVGSGGSAARRRARATGLREIVGAQLDRRAVRGAVGSAVPGVAVAREAGGVGDALLGDKALQRGEPVPVIGVAGVGIA